MSLIYGVEIRNVYEILESIVYSGKYGKELEDYQTVCLERYSDPSPEFLLRHIVNCEEEIQVINSIYKATNILHTNFVDILYIGKKLYEVSNGTEMKGLLSGDEEILELTRIKIDDKRKIEADINLFRKDFPNIGESKFFWVE